MKKKIIIYTISVIVIVNFIVMFVTLNSLQKDYINQKESELEVLTRTVVNSLDGKMDGISNYESVFAEYSVRATLISGDGNVLYDTDNDPKNMYNHASRPEVIIAYGGKIGSDVRESNTLRENFLYVAAPITGTDNVLRLSTSLSSISDSMNGIVVKTILVIIFSIITASAVIITLVEKKFVLPIVNLAENSKEVTEDQLPSRVYYPRGDSYDEISELYQNYNSMIDRINEEMYNKKSSNIFLESILANMNSGVIALDSSKLITFINKKGHEIFAVNDNQKYDTKFINVIRNFEINNFIDNFYENGKVNAAQFKLGEKYIKIFISVLPADNNSNAGTVILIEDISEAHKLEEMRREFAANVTHELKTPLTSIKGFIETIKDNDITDKNKLNRFLGIIDTEADRLRDMIDDVLLLSRVESEIPNYDKFSLKEVGQEVDSVMEPIAKENEISLNYDIEDIYFISNISRIKQLVIILVDNAIKYNVLSGSVFLNMKVADNKLSIEVSDTGLGIDKDDIGRIFERFYRADKSRSRKNGGTGLGLAIAKHIVISLGGEIKAESEIGKGSKFTISIPAPNN